jgi:protein-tyrosine phosphatase
VTSGAPVGRGDFHNHIVPGVDDGSETMAQSLEGVGRMVAAGFTRIVTTPHLDASLLRHNPEEAERYLEAVTGGFRALAERVSASFPGVDLRRGHEVRLDVPECDFTDARLRLGGTSFVLVEWPRFLIPPETVAVLTSLRGQGVRPVIAHPERYGGVEQELDLVAEWKRAGAYVQLNYGSLVGRYGPDVRNAAFALLREGLVDYFCTDFHGRPKFKLYADEAIEKLKAVGASELLQLLSVTNPERLFSDEAPLTPMRLPEGRGFWGKVHELFH